MPINTVLPGPIASRHRLRRSRTLLHWRAADYSVQPLEGPALTFSRPGSNGGLVRDVNGRGRFPAYGAPRFHCFDLDADGVFESPRLLLEPQSTNLLLRSQEFDNASWTKTRSSITPNVVTAPDGTLTADRLVEDATASSTHLASQGVTIGTIGKRISLSSFVRAGARSQCRLQTQNGADTMGATFDLSTLGVTTVAAGTGSVVRAYMEPWLSVAGVLWYRCVVIGVANTSSTTVTAQIMPAVGGTPTYSGDGASDIVVWGAQLEETDGGATSYLPTTTATLQRTLEALTATWTLVPGPLTLYYKGTDIGQGLDNIASKRLIQIGDGTTRSALIQSVNGITPVHDNGPTSVGNQLSLSVANADEVEFMATISPTGVAQAIASLNGGAQTSSNASAANSFASAYGGSPVKLAIGSQEGNSQLAAVAVAAVKIGAGVRTMQEMREMF